MTSSSVATAGRAETHESGSGVAGPSKPASRSPLRGLIRSVSEGANVQIAGRLRLLALVLHPAGSGAPRVLIVCVALAGLLHPRLLRSAWLWLALGSCLVLRLVVDWPLSDNHAYLTAYWCIAMALAWWTQEPTRAAALSARQLLALTFTLAVVWKALLSPDYLDGRFFRVTLLQDERFAHVVMLATGLTRDDITFNRDAMRPPPPGIEPFDWQPLRETRAFQAAVPAMTWGTLGFEALLAVLFLAPLGAHAVLARNGSLIAFCATTCALAPVPGFGWLLLAMGLAQCPVQARRWRAAYVVTFFLVLLYTEIPWARLALGGG